MLLPGSRSQCSIKVGHREHGGQWGPGEARSHRVKTENSLQRSEGGGVLVGEETWASF